MVRTRPVNAPDGATYTRRRLLLASVGVVLPVTVYSVVRAAGGPGSPRVTGPSTASSPLGTRAPTGPASTTPAPGPTAGPEPTVPLVAFDHDIGPGFVDEKVTALQDRLRALAFDPGPSDGVFGPATERAVWAYQKFIEGTPREEATAVVTPDMWTRLNADIDVRPRRSGPGTHVEVLLPEQVAVVYDNDQPGLITHVSSGTGDEWCDVVAVDHDDGTQVDEAICGIAVTPGGVFQFDRRVEGWRNAKLGRLYNPVYFNYGIAVHGATNVPNYPASRGCVRIPMHIAEYFPSLVSKGDLVYVFDGVEQPETYGAQPPVFDYPDPNATTTTSTSTTTAPTSPPTPPATTTHTHPTTTTSTGPATTQPPATAPPSTSSPEGTP